MRGVLGLLALFAFAGQGVRAPEPAWVTVEPAATAPVDGDLAALREKYAAALNAGDATQLGALYASDALAVMGDGAVLRGAAEIGRYFREALAAGTPAASVALRPQQFNAEEGIASETGTFHESRGDNPPDVATGAYVTIYVRRPGGEWHIAMDVRTRGRDKQIVRW